MKTLSVLLGTVLLVGCGPSGPSVNYPNKVLFVGQNAALQSGCQVNFQDGWAREKELEVKLWVSNLSQAFMNIDRDGFALRTADGRVLRRFGDVHNVYTLPPGGGHEVFVKFRDAGYDMRSNQGVSLIVGGISFSTDPRPRVVGEMPLVAQGAHE